MAIAETEEDPIFGRSSEYMSQAEMNRVLADTKAEEITGQPSKKKQTRVSTAGPNDMAGRAKSAMRGERAAHGKYSEAEASDDLLRL